MRAVASGNVDGPGQISGGATFFGSGGGNFLYSASGYELLDSLAIDRAGSVCPATILRPGITASGTGVLAATDWPRPGAKLRFLNP